jgi:hypothetical protein
MVYSEVSKLFHSIIFLSYDENWKIYVFKFGKKKIIGCMIFH